MTVAVLRVPRQPPLPSPDKWQQMIGMPGGAWPAINITSAYYNGRTYFGYADAFGDVRVSCYDHATNAIITSPAIVTGLGSDSHNAPSVLVRQSDHKILIAVCGHGAANMYVALSTNAEDVSAWGAATNIDSSIGGANYTYANLFQLSGESGKIYLFWRDSAGTANGKLRFSTSTDGGSTWSALTDLYAPPAGNSPYWGIDCDSTSRIDFVITDGEISNGQNGSVYHFYYTGGSYYKTDGTLISVSLPLAAANLTKLYDGATNGGAGTYMVIHHTAPTVVFSAADPAGFLTNPMRYWYGKYVGGSWSVNEIDDTNMVPSNSFYEPGVVVSRNDASRVLLGRSLSGVAQMLLYTTSDDGATWSSEQVTFDVAQPNILPISPRDADTGLEFLWDFGPQSPLGVTPGFTTTIRGYPNPARPI